MREIQLEMLHRETASPKASFTCTIAVAVFFLPCKNAFSLLTLFTRNVKKIVDAADRN